eukprot:GGOE01042867.1.p2 GENE.GGOE01042867.1~~GGOE01042867.1.p2  ORF type:complete len:133 (+),score=3.34 GGOE01042867.1:298-696(+)
MQSFISQRGPTRSTLNTYGSLAGSLAVSCSSNVTSSPTLGTMTYFANEGSFISRENKTSCVPSFAIAMPKPWKELKKQILPISCAVSHSFTPTAKGRFPLPLLIWNWMHDRKARGCRWAKRHSWSHHPPCSQ